MLNNKHVHVLLRKSVGSIFSCAISKHVHALISHTEWEDNKKRDLKRIYLITSNYTLYLFQIACNEHLLFKYVKW